MKNIILPTVFALVLLGCSKHSNPMPSTPPPSAPVAALLSQPAQNSACTTGTNQTSLTTDVAFSWTAAAHTNSYVLYITNLLKNSVESHSVPQPLATVTLLRGTPYSWFVVSHSQVSSDTAKSAVWKFYNAGIAQNTFAPFPATLVMPGFGAQIAASGGLVNLTWTGSAVANDIKDYDIYIGTSPVPGLYRSGVQTMYLNGVGVASGNTYYWMIVTWDTSGNSSSSQICQFYVQ